MTINFRDTQLHTSFFITKVGEENYPLIHTIVTIWQDIASQKEKLAQSSIERELFKSCDCVLDWIDQKLNPENPFSDEIFVCTNRQGFPHAIMVIHDPEDTTLSVENLVTNPINIRSAVNQFEPNRVRGAGSFLLAQAEAIARERNKQVIRLTPLDTSVAFYKNHGFAIDPVSDSDGLFDMIKTISRVVRVFACNYAETV